MAKALQAIVDGFFLDFVDGNWIETQDKFATKGVIYEIYEESEDKYYIRDDDGATHTFSKETDENGESFSTWFELVE